jgi:signal transduction histidine kinase
MQPGATRWAGRLRSAFLYVAAWIPVALGLSFALLVTDRIPAGEALAAGIGSTVPAALYGLPVIAFSRNLPWPATHLYRFVTWHILLGFAYSGAWAATIALEISLAAPPGTASLFLRQAIAWQFVMGLFVYAVITGLTYMRVAVARQKMQEHAAARAETLRLQAELNALRARLEPHFLFNVLQTLGALITERPQQAHRALELLAVLLKRRLDASAPDDDATLAEELADVRDYCALERLRLGDRLEVMERIEPETHDLLMPRFTLQPLVENAIRHGIAPRAGPGRMVLSAARNESWWTLAVSDDGAGAAADRLTNARGLGLSVIRERLRLRFGDDASVDVLTAPDAGCTVTLRLPVATDGVEETAATVAP